MGKKSWSSQLKCIGFCDRSNADHGQPNLTKLTWNGTISHFFLTNCTLFKTKLVNSCCGITEVDWMRKLGNCLENLLNWMRTGSQSCALRMEREKKERKRGKGNAYHLIKHLALPIYRRSVNKRNEGKNPLHNSIIRMSHTVWLHAVIWAHRRLRMKNQHTILYLREEDKNRFGRSLDIWSRQQAPIRPRSSGERRGRTTRSDRAPTLSKRWPNQKRQGLRKQSFVVKKNKPENPN